MLVRLIVPASSDRRLFTAIGFELTRVFYPLKDKGPRHAPVTFIRRPPCLDSLLPKRRGKETPDNLQALPA
jgi:hypothetical protein